MQAEEYTEKYTKANDRLQARNRAAKPRPIDHNDHETYEELEYSGHRVRLGWLAPPEFLDEKYQQWIRVGSWPVMVTPGHAYVSSIHDNPYDTLVPFCLEAVYDQLDRSPWSTQVAQQLKSIERSMNTKPMLVTSKDGTKLLMFGFWGFADTPSVRFGLVVSSVDEDGEYDEDKWENGECATALIEFRYNPLASPVTYPDGNIIIHDLLPWWISAINENRIAKLIFMLERGDMPLWLPSEKYQPHTTDPETGESVPAFAFFREHPYKEDSNNGR